MIHKISEYGLRALLYIASENRRNVGVREISEVLSNDIDISFSYLRKSMNLLVKKGYLHSVTGPGGGFSLSMDPASIFLLDLIRDLEGESVLNRCYLGTEECRKKNPCPFHTHWVAARERFHKSLKNATLEKMLQKP